MLYGLVTLCIRRYSTLGSLVLLGGISQLLYEGTSCGDCECLAILCPELCGLGGYGHLGYS